VKQALRALEAIYARLNGDPTVLPAARANLLLTVHVSGDQVVEHDGPEHFTSFRALTLELYPPEVPLGFDRDAYLRLCAEHAPANDRLDRALAAKGFGFGGVARERAYRDALVDLAVPAMGLPPVIRVPDL
jgi:hypothetical protein